MPQTASSGVHLLRRFTRASVMRRSFVTVWLVSALLITIPAISAALALSPQQVAARDLGEFDASLQLPLQIPAGKSKPRTTEFDQALRTAGATDSTDLLTAWSVPLGALRTELPLKEGNWPGGATRYGLSDGRWPTQPGEIVIVNPTREFGSLSLGGKVAAFNGKRTMTLVGFASDPYDQTGTAVLAAPGTWEALGTKLSTSYPNVTAGITRYWKASTPIPRELIAHAWASATGADPSEAAAMALSYTTRPGLLSTGSDPLLAKFPLTLIIPLFVLPLAAGLLIGVTVRRWLDRTGRTLWQVGVAPALVKRAGRQAVALSNAIGLAAGAGTAATVAALMRPILEATSTQPLSPWSVPWGALGLVTVGQAAGLAGGLFTHAPHWRVRNTRWLLQLGIVGAVGMTAVALAGGITAVSLSVATGAIVVGAALCSPSLISVGLRLPSRPHALARLPRLLIESERARAALAVGGLILALALPTCAITIVLTAEAAEQRASLDTLPPGYVIMNSLNDKSIPATIQSRFEEYSGLRDPVRATMVAVDERSPDFAGAIWEFESTAAIETWLGHPLDPEQAATLRTGLLTTAGPDVGAVSLREGHSSATLPTMPLEVAPEWPQNVGGVVITGTLSERFTRAPARLIYVHVSPDQLALVRSAASTLGFSRSYVQYPHASDAVTFPTRYFVAVAAMGLAPALIMGAWASTQTRQSRPVLASLHALGLPRLALVSVVVRQAGLLVALAGVAAAVCICIVATATSLGSDDRLVVVPWQSIAITVVSAVISTGTATASGLLRLTAPERLNA